MLHSMQSSCYLLNTGRPSMWVVAESRMTSDLCFMALPANIWGGGWEEGERGVGEGREGPARVQFSPKLWLAPLQADSQCTEATSRCCMLSDMQRCWAASGRLMGRHTWRACLVASLTADSHCTRFLPLSPSVPTCSLHFCLNHLKESSRS